MFGLSFLLPLVVGFAYFVASARIIDEGNQALVERLGEYRRTLNPGLNFVVPFIDTVIVESVRERTTDIRRQKVITKDELSIEVDAIVYWQLVDLPSAFYKVENLEDALANLVLAEVRAQFGQIDLAQTFSQIDQINRVLLSRLDEVTGTWGIKVKRVAIQEITPSTEMRQSMEAVQLAENKRQAELQEAQGRREARIAEAEGSKLAAISEAEGIVQSMQLISAALYNQPNNRDLLREVVQFLVAQRYVNASQELGKSPNSKVIFMDPKSLNEAVGDLMYGSDPNNPARRANLSGSEGPPPDPPSDASA